MQVQSNSAGNRFYLHRDGWRYIALGLLFINGIVPPAARFLATIRLYQESVGPDLGFFIIPPLCIALGVWCFLSVLNTSVTLSDTHLILQDWKKAKTAIRLDSITGVFWHPATRSYFPELVMEYKDD